MARPILHGRIEWLGALLLLLVGSARAQEPTVDPFQDYALKESYGPTDTLSETVRQDAMSSQESTTPEPGDVWDAGYDRGFYLRGNNGNESFELRTNMRLQFRFVAFTRAEDVWTDNAGVERPILDRQYFDIERGRLIFSGHAFTPKLTYFAQFDSDTDSAHVTSLLDGWVGWEYRDNRVLQLGKRKVPGTRNWILGAFDTRMVDRPISNEFFRPSRTTGMWIVGDPDPETRYELMIGQGYNTEGLTPTELGENFAIAGSVYRDVIGNYGPLRPTDFEYHEDLAVRLGMSAVGSIEGTPGRQLEETDFLRLTDGTRITEPMHWPPTPKWMVSTSSYSLSMLPTSTEAGAPTRSIFCDRSRTWSRMPQFRPLGCSMGSTAKVDAS
jgi:hypothetical protein